MQAAKRKAEQALATLQEEYEELEGESQENADKLRKAVDLSSRSQTELLAAQEKLRSLEKSKVSECMVFACAVADWRWGWVG